MKNAIQDTLGNKVRFKIGHNDFIGLVTDIDYDDDCLVMTVGSGPSTTRVTLRIDAIDAILQFVD